MAYAFTTNTHARRGLAATYEASIVRPNELNWDIEPKEIPHDLWLVASLTSLVRQLLVDKNNSVNVLMDASE